MSWDGIATPTLIPLMDVQLTQHARNVGTKGLLIRKVIFFRKDLVMPQEFDRLVEEVVIKQRDDGRYSLQIKGNIYVKGMNILGKDFF